MLGIAVMTAPRAVDYLTGTLESTEKAGLECTFLVFDGRIGDPLPETRCCIVGSTARLGIVPTFRRALAEACDYDQILILQDDIAIDPSLVSHLSALPSERGIFSLYISPDRAAFTPPGWSLLPDDGKYPINLGACGLLFDRETARMILDDPPFERVDRLGSQLAIWARRRQVPFYLHNPGWITHRGLVRCRDGLD